jgi:hypothetical protein
MNAQIANINNQITTLRAKWQTLAATGSHAEAVGVENEITALERSSVRIGIQHQAEQVEAARARAVEAATATLEQIERHRATRVEVEAVMAEVESLAKAVEAAFARLDCSFVTCLASYPSFTTFKNVAQQEAYNEALSGNRYPQFAPLKLSHRLPIVMALLRARSNGGLNGILGRADNRF